MSEYKIGDEPVAGYQIIRPLGAGGYGTVWVAKSPGDVEIALKIISLQGQGLKEFRAISLVKRLRHPNLIPIYAFWLKDEYGNFLDSTVQDSVNLRGRSSELIIAYGLGDKSLAQRLDECKDAFAQRHNLPNSDVALIARLQELNGTELAGLPTEELLDYMSGAAKAIDYLNQPTHNLGAGPPAAIQHCDIKPGNLLIVSSEVQVCDYGLARVTDDARKTQAAGTPAYMAPELFANKPSNGTDQYSLAITYYELRTGKLPFEESVAFHAHIMGQLDYGLLPANEQEILRRASHMRPDQRFPHTIEMVRALREAITPTRSGTPQSTPIIGSSAQHQPLSGQGSTAQHQPLTTPSSGVYKSGGAAAPGSASSTPTVITKPQVLDDLIRGGVELVPGHRLEVMLGRGGYGEVWSATMPGKTKCALKIVRNLDATQGKQEFKSLDMIRDLDHDRLIRLQAYWLLAYDGSVIPDDLIGTPGAPKASGLVVATDLAHQNLLQRWQEWQEKGEAGIPKEELVRYLHQSAEAIDYLNFLEPAIVHRDIKPENILLTKNGQVKVSDFGLAKLVEGTSAAINSASVGMTLAYAAPELFRNQVTRWTDQYSLALTYYRLRVGRLPFEDGMGPIQMMQAHASGTLDFSGVSESEQTVLRRACAVEPQARFTSCVEFVDSLAQAAGISRSNISTPSMQSHPVSSPAIGTASTGPRRPAATDRQAAAAFAMTAPFPGLAPSESDPATGRPRMKSSTAAPPHPSSGEIQLPKTRSVPARSLPAGLMVTTNEIPSAADVDTDSDGPRPNWRDAAAGPRPSGGGGKKVAIAAVAAAVFAAVGIGAYAWKNWPVKSVPVVPPETSLVERQEKLTADIDGKLKVSDFGGAAQLVKDTIEKESVKAEWATWEVMQNKRILDGWQEYAERKSSKESQLREYDRLLAAYQGSPLVQGALARATDIRNSGSSTPPPPPPPPPPNDDALIAALNSALDLLKSSNYAGCVEKLDTMKNLGGSPGNEFQRRADALRGRLEKLISAGKTDPTEAGVIRLADGAAAFQPQGRPDDPLLFEEYHKTLARKIQQLAPKLASAKEWDKLLNACRLAATVPTEPTASWVTGLEAECAAELLALEAPPTVAVLDEIEGSLKTRKPPDPTNGYLPFVQARLAWQRRNDQSAVETMLRQYPDAGNLTEALLIPRRKLAAAAVFEEAGAKLRQPDPMAPFKVADAPAALARLKAAARLAKVGTNNLSASLRLNLALAAWVAGDKTVAQATVREFADAGSRKGWQTADALAYLCARIAVEDGDTDAGRRARTESRSEIAALAQDAIKRKHADEVPDTLVYGVVVQPILAEANRPLIGKNAARARLFADVARLIQTQPGTWEPLIGKGDPWPIIRDLYAAAAQSAEKIEAKAEYVVQRVFASLPRDGTGTGANIAALLAEAEQITKDAPNYAGGFTLHGELLHLRAVGEYSNPKAQIDDLRLAVKDFEKAEKINRDQPANDQTGTGGTLEDARCLYQSWSGVCLLLGNFTTDAAEKSRAFEEAARHAKELTTTDKEYLDGFIALGNANEDLAYFLGRGEYFVQAIQAFSDADRLATDKPNEYRPLLGRGRSQYRRAQRAPGDGQAGEWLKKAIQDLKAAVVKLSHVSPDNPDAKAEANYFLGLCYVLRSGFGRDVARTPEAETDAGLAEAALGLAAKEARRDDYAKSRRARPVLVAQCALERDWAEAVFAENRPMAIKHWDLGQTICTETLIDFPGALALEKGKLRESQAKLAEYSQKLVDDIIQGYSLGLQAAKPAEKDEKYEIALRLGRVYALAQPPSREYYEKAFTNLELAAELAPKAGRQPRDEAEALKEAGLSRLRASSDVSDKLKKLEYLDKFADDYRRSFELDSSDPLTWFYKNRVAVQYDVRFRALENAVPEGPSRRVGAARILEESARYFREMDRTMPAAQRPEHWTPSAELRARIEMTMRKDLPRLIEEFKTEPDVWKWQWTLAEYLARDGSPDGTAAAKKVLAAITEPKTAPKADLNRIRQLRDDLANRK